jgi:hypothetical protein
MKRIALILALAAPLSGCIIHSHPRRNTAPMEVVHYQGSHRLPAALRGTWCQAVGVHSHEYHPDRPEHYLMVQGVYHWRGPVEYLPGHPMPGGGWCYVRAAHAHPFLPPQDPYWAYRPGQGFIYSGPHHATRPPPPNYWPGQPSQPAQPAQPGPVRPAPAPVHHQPSPAPPR